MRQPASCTNINAPQGSAGRSKSPAKPTRAGGPRNSKSSTAAAGARKRRQKPTTTTKRPHAAIEGLRNLHQRNNGSDQGADEPTER